MQDIGTVDRAIQNIKKALERTGNMDSLADRLDKVIAGINKTPHVALHDVAPQNVESKPDLVFELRREAAFGMKHNSEVIKKRADALEKDGAYRTIDKQKYEKGSGG